MEALLPLVLLIAVFYFLLIRPQQRQRRQIAEVQQTLAPGTRVMTGAGLIATVVSIDNDEVELEVAPGVTNRYVRRAIVQIIPEPGQVPDDPAGAEPGATEIQHNPVGEQNDNPDGNTR